MAYKNTLSEKTDFEYLVSINIYKIKKNHQKIPENQELLVKANSGRGILKASHWLRVPCPEVRAPCSNSQLPDL